jgi:hypothetical protein
MKEVSALDRGSKEKKKRILELWAVFTLEATIWPGFKNDQFNQMLAETSYLLSNLLQETSAMLGTGNQILDLGDFILVQL